MTNVNSVTYIVMTMVLIQSVGAIATTIQRERSMVRMGEDPLPLTTYIVLGVHTPLRLALVYLACRLVGTPSSTIEWAMYPYMVYLVPEFISRFIITVLITIMTMIIQKKELANYKRKLQESVDNPEGDVENE